MISRHRDIQLIEKDNESYLAIACDVSGAIGPKVHDVIKLSGEIAGYYATAVPIIELLAIGAKPISVIDTLGVEMNGVGQKVILGVQKAMVEGDIGIECLTGSTEDNMPTTSTTIGITVISDLSKVLLETYKPRIGQEVYVVGLPKMGEEFLEDEIMASKGEVITIEAVKKMRHQSGVGHMLPVGSKGIAYELETMLKMYGLSISQEVDHGLNLLKSAGPASCMLVTSNDGLLQELKAEVSQPLTYIGRLI